jgi:ketosteroid isomerase-like protein
MLGMLWQIGAVPDFSNTGRRTNDMADEATAAHETLASALERVDTALRSLWSGDPEPYSACWARSDDVTLFGAWGPIERGWKAATETFRWVASRMSGEGIGRSEHAVVAESGDLAYTVGFERRTTSIDGGPGRERVLRVTHIYRCTDGKWQLLHRHADYPPSDPRQAGR